MADFIDSNVDLFVYTLLKRSVSPHEKFNINLNWALQGMCHYNAAP